MLSFQASSDSLEIKKGNKTELNLPRFCKKNYFWDKNGKNAELKVSKLLNQP